MFFGEITHEDCSTCKPPASHHARPRETRGSRATGKPVVSVSKKSHFPDLLTAARVLRESASSRDRESRSSEAEEGSEYSGVEKQLRIERCSPEMILQRPPRRGDARGNLPRLVARRLRASRRTGRAGFRAGESENLSAVAAILGTQTVENRERRLFCARGKITAAGPTHMGSPVPQHGEISSALRLGEPDGV